MRVTIGKTFAAILLTLCIGVQVLEASGRWDRAIQDTGDEALIVTVVLCIGAAVAAAGAILLRLRLSPIGWQLFVARTVAPIAAPTPAISFASAISPPISLRI